MKNEKWLITIDLDGTLLKDAKAENSNCDWHPKNKEILDKMCAEGHKVAIITGRPWRDSKFIYEALGLNTLIATYNGAHIHLPNSDSFIDLNFSMNSKTLMKIFNEPILKKVTNAIIVETLQGTFSQNGDRIHLDRMSDNNINHVSWKLEQGLPIDPQAAYIGIDFSKIDPYDVLHILKRKFGNSMMFRLWDERENEGWVLMEINQIFANKGSAMEYIASYYNIPLSNTIAFGDGLNDKEMLSQASFGVAMKNAKGTVKTYAKDTTDFSNNDGGVGKYLESFFK